jgi:hypothetical protein
MGACSLPAVMGPAISATTGPPLLVDRPIPADEPEPAHREVAEHERVRLYRTSLAAHPAIADQRRALTQAVGQAPGRGTTSRIDAESDFGPVRRVEDPFRQRGRSSSASARLMSRAGGVESS